MADPKPRVTAADEDAALAWVRENLSTQGLPCRALWNLALFRAEARAETLERAARFIEGHVVASGSEGSYLKAESRIGTNDVGRALYAEGIRRLADE